MPLIGFQGEQTNFSLAKMLDVARTARRLGFHALAANDHLVFPTPWLDGPSVLAAVLSEAEGLCLTTTVSLPVIRGPLALAKTLSTLDVLSGGRVRAGVGPGSSARDYAAAGIPFEERWPRLDEAVRYMRALFNPDLQPLRAAFTPPKA